MSKAQKSDIIRTLTGIAFLFMALVVSHFIIG